MKVMLAQSGAKYCDLKKIASVIETSISIAAQDECDLLILPELMTVYPINNAVKTEQFWT